MTDWQLAIANLKKPMIAWVKAEPRKDNRRRCRACKRKRAPVLFNKTSLICKDCEFDAKSRNPDSPFYS